MPAIVRGQLVRSSDEVMASPLGEQTALLDRNRGVFYTLDEIGGFIWERLATPSSPDAIASELCQHYDVDRATAERDVMDFLTQLSDVQLVLPATI